MNRRILCVDDEANVLQALDCSLCRDFDISTASSGAEALDILRDNPPYAVIVSDMRMPGMSGAELLSRAKERCPDTVRILLTGQADMNDAIAAVNRGGIFRYLCKPCPTSLITESLEAGIEQHRLVTAEKQLLENTLSGVVKILTDLLAITSPAVFNRAVSLRSFVSRIMDLNKQPHEWRFELAAQLALVGCIALPPDLVEKVLAGAPVSAQERRMFGKYPETGRQLIGSVPRLEAVAEIVGHQLEPDLTVIEDEDIRRGVELLQAALAVDESVAKGALIGDAIRQVCLTIRPTGKELLGTIASLDDTEQAATKSLSVVELQPDMTLDADVVTSNGQVILARGCLLTYLHLHLLNNFAELVGLVEPIKVRMPQRSYAPSL